MKKSILIFIVITVILVVFTTAIPASEMADRGYASAQTATSLASTATGICSHRKIGVVGASNTVIASHRRSWAQYIDDWCPTTEVFVQAEIGASPLRQISLLNSLLSAHPDVSMVLLDPSANGLDGDFDAYKRYTIQLAQIAKGSGRTVVMLTPTPFKGWTFIKASYETAQSRVDIFNNDLLNNRLGHSELIDFAVNTYSATEVPPNSDSCGNLCPVDHAHFNNEGMMRKATAVMQALGGQAPSAAPTAPTPTTTLAQQVQAPSGQLQQQGCQSSQRCQEIDETWQEISSSVGGIGQGRVLINHNGALVWASYADVYLQQQRVTTITSPTPTPTTPRPAQVQPTTTGAIADPQMQAEVSAGKYDLNFLRRVEQVSASLGINPVHLMAVMSFETGATFNPCARNEYSGATGLIQFIPDTARSLGTTTDDLCRMSQLQQMDYVKKYFERYRGYRRNNIGDVAMGVFAPAAIGKSDSHVLYTSPSRSYEGNRPLDVSPNDGKITRKEYIDFVLKRNKYNLNLQSIFTGSGSTGQAAQILATGSCPSDMVRVGNFCIDRYEGTLVDKNSGQAWSPYNNPGTNINNLKAVSVAGKVPQGYISGDQANIACSNAEKRLCTDSEWKRACMGTEGRKFPYGNDEVAGKCNYGHRNVAYALYGDYDHRHESDINQQPNTVEHTGAKSQCVSPEGVYDLVGNLQEWVADNNGNPTNRFRGWYYVGTIANQVDPRNGGGCSSVTTAHPSSDWDYTTGLRCCKSLS